MGLDNLAGKGGENGGTGVLPKEPAPASDWKPIPGLSARRWYSVCDRCGATWDRKDGWEDTKTATIEGRPFRAAKIQEGGILTLMSSDLQRAKVFRCDCRAGGKHEARPIPPVWFDRMPEHGANGTRVLDLRIYDAWLRELAEKGQGPERRDLIPYPKEWAGDLIDFRNITNAAQLQGLALLISMGMDLPAVAKAKDQDEGILRARRIGAPVVILGDGPDHIRIADRTGRVHTLEEARAPQSPPATAPDPATGKEGGAPETGQEAAEN